MKDPAFLFYSSDFLAGTMLMSDEEIGQYIKLLCLQHQKGHLTEKDMLIICKTYNENIFCKFIQDEEGNYYNKRLEEEVIKRQKYSESRRNNRKKKDSEEQKEETCEEDMKNICNSYDEHMGNGNINRNININNNINIKEKEKEKEIKLLQCNADVTQCNTDIDIDKELDIDKKKNKKENRTPTLEEIQEYIQKEHLNVDGKFFFDYFEVGNWIDSNGNKVKNWKQKLLTWHKRNQTSNNQLRKPKEVPTTNLDRWLAKQHVEGGEDNATE